MDSPERSTGAPAPAAQARWLDAFFASYYRRRPVDATFIGVHEHDHALPDLSANGVADLVAEMEALLATCPVADREAALGPRGSALDLDCAVAADFLAIQIAECRGAHFWAGNPCVYTGEAIFGVLALFLREYAPLPERARAAVARLRAIPALLAQGRANLRAAPAEWTARAIRECQGALHFLGAGIDRLILDYGLATPGLRAAADEAAAAFAAYRDWLRDDLAAHPTARYAAGSAFFDLLMRRGHHLDHGGAAVAARAREVFAASEEGLIREAGAFGVAAGDWRGVLARLADSHPDTAGYLDRYRQTWADARRVAIARELVTWPDFPIAYQPFPAWARDAQPLLYFLFYRAPGPFDLPRVPVHPYLVTPVEPTMPPEEQTRRLRATNDAVIKANHVIHHGGLGHHVQNWHAARATSRIGQIAAVDCAARIALFSGGTMAEGWACYATSLMDECGFLTPPERFAERHARLRMAARAICDVGLHDGSLGLDDAVALYRDRVGMAPEAARAEAVKNTMFPGAAMIYLSGTDAIRDLRAALAARDGAAFRLRDFHDRFLAHGSLPVALIARRMLAAPAGG